MLIILEGPDLAGKTTFAGVVETIATDLGYLVTRMCAKQPAPGTDALDEYELTLHHMRHEIMDPGSLVILDRWHLGELVYGPLLRCTSRLTDAQFTHIESFLCSLGAVKVLIDAPNDYLLARHTARGDDLINKISLPFVADRFRLQALDRRWPVLDRPGDEAARDLITRAVIRTDQVSPLFPYPGYVGAAWPFLLVIGDDQGRPAFMPRIGTSSGFFMEALDRTDLTTWGLAGIGTEMEMRDLWRALSRPRVMALGSEVSARLTEAGIPHVEAPDPAWATENGRYTEAGYARALKYCLNPPRFQETV